jgi:hypothetical protein
MGKNCIGLTIYVLLKTGHTPSEMQFGDTSITDGNIPGGIFGGIFKIEP